MGSVAGVDTGVAGRSSTGRAGSAAWAFDLLARVEQWQSTGPLDFLRNPRFPPLAPWGEGSGVRGVQASYGRLPMHFEPNLGQTADEVKFVARGPGYTLFLTADEAVLALRPSRPALQTGRTAPPAAAFRSGGDDPRRRTRRARRGDSHPAGRDPQPRPATGRRGRNCPASATTFGNDPAKWRTNVPHYQRVRYPNVYPGIDLVYYGNPQRLEHDFIVAPGADPATIQLRGAGDGQRRW